MRRTVRATVLVALMMLMVSGCVGLPDSGPVHPGEVDQSGMSNSGLEYIAELPAPGASQEDIVLGFLQAAISPSENFAIAREYLTGAYQSGWDPEASVTVRTGQPSVVETGQDNLDVTSDVAGSLDQFGRYAAQEGQSARLEFTLVAVDGEWRISSGPDGIVLTAFYFERLFHTTPISWYSADERFGVPDVRWFPVASQSRADSVVDAVLAGPSEWLSPAVWSISADDAARRSSVQFEEGVASVELSAALALVDRPGDMAKIAEEMRAALVAAGISIDAVEVVIDGVTVSSLDAPSLSGTALGEPIGIVDGSLQVLATDAPAALNVASEVARDAPVAATVTNAGDLGVTLQGGEVRLVTPDNSRTLDTNVQVAPTLDRFGYAWWVDASGTVLASNGGDRVSLGLAADGRAIAVAMARDGSRLAVLTEGAEGSRVSVFGVVRNRDDAPNALTSGVSLPDVAGVGVDVSWMDAASLVIVSVDNGETTVIDAEVGGSSQQLVAPASAIRQVVGSDNGITGVRLLDSNGAVLALRAGEWTTAVDTVRADTLVTRI